MNLKTIITYASVAVILLSTPLTASISAENPMRYVGGDISLLPEYEKAGAKYFDHDGTPIDHLLPFLHNEGMNAMRVRLFVDPDKYSGSDADPNACQSMEYIIPLCREIKENGFALMLDFHYSDTWADPGKQWTPAAWANLSDDELYAKIYDYTKESLQTLADAGVVPEFIQTGNEISFGMLWGPYGSSDSDLKKTFLGSDDNWERLGKLLKNAIKACREECPDAKIVLHTERTADVAVQDNFYTRMHEMDVNYDIIGLSYYPYFHGPLSSLNTAINSLEQNFPDKEIMVVETGYSYKWEVPGSNVNVDYPYSDEGQNQFAKDLVDMLLSHEKVTGLFWWWMEYNAYSTNLSGWYNAPLFDSTTGRATSALKTICGFASESGSVSTIDASCPVNDIYYNLNGQRVFNPSQGLYINNGRKILITQ